MDETEPLPPELQRIAELTGDRLSVARLEAFEAAIRAGHEYDEIGLAMGSTAKQPKVLAFNMLKRLRRWAREQGIELHHEEDEEATT